MGLLDKVRNQLNPPTIDILKSAIAKRGGLATTNRFAIFMSPPTSTFINLDIQGLLASSASGNFNSKDFFNDPRDIGLLCESCTLPGKQITTLDYPRSGYKNNIKVPNGYFNEDVTFSFHLTNDFYVKKIFDKWVNSIISPDTYNVAYDSDYKTDVTIQQLDQQNVPVAGIKLKDAFPISLNAVTLDNNALNSTQKLSVVMAYSDVIAEGALSSVLSGAKSLLSGVLNIF